ncbi:MAG: IS630 family transposase, partial [Planctomycetaceae bacterium]
MPNGRPKAALTLSPSERETLEGFARRRTTSQAIALRARIVLLCATGRTNLAVADDLGITH